jgi:uncharacterized protein
VKPVLLDTGCIVALLDQAESFHEHCVNVVEHLAAPLVTCEPVIAESCFLLRRQRGAPAAVLRNVEVGNFQIPFRLAEQATEVRKIVQKYADLQIDLADACLVQLANRFQTGEILTLDGDFKTLRWGKNRSFDLLLEI